MNLSVVCHYLGLLQGGTPSERRWARGWFRRTYRVVAVDWLEARTISRAEGWRLGKERAWCGGLSHGLLAVRGL